MLQMPGKHPEQSTAMRRKYPFIWFPCASTQGYEQKAAMRLVQTQRTRVSPAVIG
ncbi:MAG: hypothetical protein LUH10_03670 [Tannerellaceae bacterium]|nr:hypothetical protein [Tannerellaceae bacterium]